MEKSRIQTTRLARFVCQLKEHNLHVIVCVLPQPDPVVYQHETKALEIFKEVYLSRKKELKTQVSYAVLLCNVCDCVYWKDYGHPCTTPITNSPQPLTAIWSFQNVCTGLTSQQFLDLFQC
jgi:hypothetical protein